MSNSSINPAGAVTDAGYDGGSHHPPTNHPAVAPIPSSDQDPAADSADLRLVIEDDEAAGSHIYKAIDRRTGEVVHQFAREEVLRLREAPDYTVGAVIKAKV